MSLRFRTRVFDLSKLRTRFGSGDASLIDAIDRHAASAATGPAADAFRAVFREALRRAVDQGVPFPDLDAEKGPHVALAMTLAGHDQRLRRCGSDDWTWSSCLELSTRCRDALGAGREPLGHLLVGRPLFGLRFDTGWGYYGYLSGPEVLRLRTSLAGLMSGHPELAAVSAVCGPVHELTLWCDRVLNAKKDLWFWTS